MWGERVRFRAIVGRQIPSPEMGEEREGIRAGLQLDDRLLGPARGPERARGRSPLFFQSTPAPIRLQDPIAENRRRAYFRVSREAETFQGKGRHPATIEP